MKVLATGPAAVMRRVLGAGLLGSRGAKRHDAADGKQKQSAKPKAGVERGERARDFADDDGEAEREPEADAAADVVHHGCGVADGEREQQKEGEVYADLDAEEPAEWNGRAEHLD